MFNFSKVFNILRRLKKHVPPENEDAVSNSSMAKETVKETAQKVEVELGVDESKAKDHQAVIDTSVFEKNQAGQKRILSFLLIVVVVGGLLWLFIALLSPKSKVVKGDAADASSTQKPAGEFVKVKGATFTAEDNKSALTHQQRQIDDMISQLDKLKTDNQSLTESLNTQREHFAKENAELKKVLETQKQEIQKTQKTQKTENTRQSIERAYQSDGDKHRGAQGGLPHGQSLSQIEGIDHGQEPRDIFGREDMAVYAEPMPVVRLPESFSKTVVATDKVPEYVRTHHNYVPTGTFCEAVLLGAAEAQAGVDAQGDASPILFELKNQCVLPNGKGSHLKGAFITASVYGRISSSRGMVRLEHLSLVRKDGSILDIGVEGTAFDISGKNGIRGDFKLRNDKVIMNAGIAGLLSGLGESASQYSQTQSISPLGSTSTIDASKILPNALGKGVSQSFAEISKYYIEFAKQFQPTIDLRAGAKVNIVFLKGFPILDEARIRAYEQKVERAREEKMKKANMQNVQNVQNEQNMQNGQGGMTLSAMMGMEGYPRTNSATSSDYGNHGDHGDSHAVNPFAHD